MLEFRELISKGKTKIFNIFSGQTCIGQIKWWSHWRRYTLHPSTSVSTVWDVNCLDEVTNFIDKLMEERKEK